MTTTVTRKILTWFDKQGRKHLPWQQNPTLYRVWVSEIMLQQTQVNTVIPYYERFMQKFPDLSSLAKAPLDTVLREWTGLGYYARARNLHKTAGIILEKHQGNFPKDFESLLQLPGIGRSTAGAILALSTQQHYPILDGNVRRVLCRLFAIEGWPSHPKITEKLWRYSEQLTPKKRVHHYTQAIMDLGAMVCTRTKPHCTVCPLHEECLARIKNKQQAYPNPRPNKLKPSQSIYMMIALHPKKKGVLLEKRPMKGIWGGLWSFPECKELTHIEQSFDADLNITIESKQPLPVFRHTFTHFHLDIHPVLCRVNFLKEEKRTNEKQPNGKTKTAIPTQSQKNSFKNLTNTTTRKNQYCWHPLNKPLEKGVPAPIKRLLETISENT